MKNTLIKIFYTIILVAFAQHAARAQAYTLIEGTVRIPVQREVNVTIVTDVLTNERTILSTPIDDKDHFKLAFRINQPAIVRLESGFENLLIYVSPNQRSQVSWDADRMWQTINWTGDGANNNSYMVAYHNKFDGKELDQTYIDLQTTGMTTDNFVAYMQGIKNRKEQFLLQYQQTHPLSPNFVEYARGDIMYNWASCLLRFAQDQQWQVPPSYYQFLEQVPIENPHLADSRVYNDFLQRYFAYRYHTDPNPDGISALVGQYYLTKTHLRDTSLLYLQLAKIILYGAEQAKQTGDVSSLDEIYPDFEANNPYASYRTSVSQAMNNARRFAVGSPAPLFTLRNLQGEMVSLADFRGRIVYLSFWASWCHACLQQTSNIIDLRRQLSDSTVVFLYVSVDKDENAWRQAIAKKQLPGIQLLAPDGLHADIAQQYNIGGVPLYFLIDPNGNFAAKPPIPSAKEAFMEQVNTLWSRHKKMLKWDN